MMLLKKFRMGKKEKCLGMKNIHFIQLLASYRFKPSNFKKLIEGASKNEINAISEIILNVLKGNLPCGKEKEKLRKKASYLRFIGNYKNPCTKRKEYLVKKGNGIIGPLLSIAVPALISLFSRK